MLADKVRVEPGAHQVGAWCPRWPAIHVVSYAGVCTSAFPTCLCEVVRAEWIVRLLVVKTFRPVLAAVEIGVITCPGHSRILVGPFVAWSIGQINQGNS